MRHGPSNRRSRSVFHAKRRSRSAVQPVPREQTKPFEIELS